MTDDIGSRVRGAATRLGCSPAEAVALAVLVAGAAAVLGLLWWLQRPGAIPEASMAGAPGAPAEGVTAADTPVGPVAALPGAPLVVHVAGQVANPGLVQVPGGSRVADALAAAGGPLPDAVLEALNLARPLSDGEQLFVPGPAAATAAPPGAPGSGAPAAGPLPGGSGAVRPDGKLDLNRATVAELEELPSVGPVLTGPGYAMQRQPSGEPHDKDSAGLSLTRAERAQARLAARCRSRCLVARPAADLKRTRAARLERYSPAGSTSIPKSAAA